MTSCQAQWRLFVWCLFLSMTGPACAQTIATTASPTAAGWSDWSNGMRMRVTPTRPIFAPTEAPSLLVEFQVQRPVVASIPYLLPNDTNSTIGPFTLLEVWVWNTHSKEKYLATFEGLSLGRCFALGPEGSSVQRLSPGTNVTATLRLDGRFLPLKRLEMLREAREKNLCISLDFLPKDLKRLPAGKYTLSLNVAPRPLADLPACKRETMLNPPHVYRDIWTGTLGIHGIEFDVASAEAVAGPGSAGDRIPVSAVGATPTEASTSDFTLTCVLTGHSLKCSLRNATTNMIRYSTYTIGYYEALVLERYDTKADRWMPVPVRNDSVHYRLSAGASHRDIANVAPGAIVPPPNATVVPATSSFIVPLTDYDLPRHETSRLRVTQVMGTMLGEDLPVWKGRVVSDAVAVSP